MKFRVLVGKHREYGFEYKKGDVVDSKSDLSKQNHPNAGSMKFERVEDNTKADEGTPYARQNFGHMPPAEVTAHAAAVAAVGPASSNAPAAPPAPKPASNVSIPPANSPPKSNPLNLDAMSVKDLQDYAAAQEIETKGSTRKDELLRIIRAAG